MSDQEAFRQVVPTHRSRVEVSLAGVLTGHLGPVYEVCFSPDGSLLLSAAEDESLLIWDMAERRQRYALPIPAWNLAFAPDMRTFAFTSGPEVFVCSTDGNIEARLGGHASPATSVTFSPMEEILITGDAAGIVRLWSRRTWTMIDSFALVSPSLEHAGKQGKPSYFGVHFLALEPGGHRLAAAFSDTRGSTQIWKLIRPSSHTPSWGLEWVRALMEPDKPVCSIHFSPDGELLMLVEAQRDQVWLFDGQTLERRQVLRLPSEHQLPTGAVFSPDGQFFAVATGEGVVWVWSTRDLDVSGTFSAHSEGWFDYSQHDTIGGIDWSPCGDKIATSGMSSGTRYDEDLGDFTGPADYTIKLWDIHMT